MLATANLLITIYFLVQVALAGEASVAAGYLALSGLQSMPLLIMGNTVNAGVFSIDLVSLVFVVRHGPKLMRKEQGHKASCGVPFLCALACLATLSFAVNYLIDPSPIRFYAAATAKFVQYALVALLISRFRMGPGQRERTFALLLGGAAVYELLHMLHITGLVPLSAIENAIADPADIHRVFIEDPLVNPYSLFLTAMKAVVGGTATVNFWIGTICLFCKYGRKPIAVFVMAASAVSVVAITSRSDIVGLVASAVAFCVILGRRGSRVIGVLLPLLLLGAVASWAYWNVSGDTVSERRFTELWDTEQRTLGTYESRVADRLSLTSHLLTGPAEFYVGAGPGNFRRFRAIGVTINAFGHNSYLHWFGELGIGGLLGVVGWCASTLAASASVIRRSRHSGHRVIIAAGLFGLVVSRIVAGWGAESLFGTDGMGYYSLYFVGTVYLFWAASRSKEAVPEARTTGGRAEFKVLS